MGKQYSSDAQMVAFGSAFSRNSKPRPPDPHRRDIRRRLEQLEERRDLADNPDLTPDDVDDLTRW